MSTIRILIALFVTQNWTLHQLDVKNIFMYGNIDEEVHVIVWVQTHIWCVDLEGTSIA